MTKAPSKKQAPEQEPEPIDGIVVRVVSVENGKTLTIQPLGAVQTTEIPTLLRIAAKQTEEQLGI